MNTKNTFFIAITAQLMRHLVTGTLGYNLMIHMVQTGQHETPRTWKDT